MAYRHTLYTGNAFSESTAQAM